MKYFLFFCTLLVISAVQEPESINEEEKHDEIAQSQMRAKWIACLSIASSRLEKSSAEIQEILSKSSHSHEVIVKKLAADILETCEKKITWRQAEEILSEEQGTNLADFIGEVSQINTLQFQQPTIIFSERQKQLIQEIVEEMQRKDDGFDQPVPTVQEVINSSSSCCCLNCYATAAGVGLIGILIIWKLFFSRTEETKEKESSKKKKRE